MRLIKISTYKFHLLSINNSQIIFWINIYKEFEEKRKSFIITITLVFGSFFIVSIFYFYLLYKWKNLKKFYLMID